MVNWYEQALLQHGAFRLYPFAEAEWSSGTAPNHSRTAILELDMFERFVLNFHPEV